VATIEELARSYWKAEESRDVDGIMRHFSADATWEGPGVMAKGRDEIRLLYESSVENDPRLEVSVRSVVGDAQMAAIEWRASLVDASGDCRTLRGVNVMEGNGSAITTLRTYSYRADE
jgi:ketosteroid isomerase-like protein